MSDNNLKLWDSISKTDPKYTKKVTFGRAFTSITPIYQAKMATKIFGVQGIKWGIFPDSEKFSEREIGDTILLNYDAVMYFHHEGEIGEIPIHACTELAAKTKNGVLKVDADARKKVVTSAKSKGFSDIGMCADIFMGEFEDYEYFKTREEEANLERNEGKSEEKLKGELEYDSYIEKQLKLIGESVNMNMLKACYKEAMIKATVRKDDKAQIKLTKAKDAKKLELEGNDNVETV